MASNHPKPIPELTPKESQRFWDNVDKTPGHGPDGECWIWTGNVSRHGYGKFSLMHPPRTLAAHRVAYLIRFGIDAFPLMVLHRCDNRLCVRHLFTGTHTDNMKDMAQKGRAASGDRHGWRLHPESKKTGDDHWTHRMPERLARGERSGSRLHPDTRVRGDNHWTRKNPASVLRGENATLAKLTWDQVREIRSIRAADETVTFRQLARTFGVSDQTIMTIVYNRTWKDDPVVNGLEEKL